MRLYRARVSGEKQERQGARLDLQSIPEASPPPRDIGPLHFRRAGSAQLSRCPSGPLFPPQPGLSSCSTPSCQRRAALQQRNYSLELLNSSLQHLDRRRASHPSVNHHRASEHHCWQPAPDDAYIKQEHQTPPREPLCKEFRLGSEDHLKDMVERGSERQGGWEHQCLMLSHPQDVNETWSKPAGGPDDTFGPNRQPLQHAGSYRQPLQHAGTHGQPLQHAGSYRQPPQHTGSYGQPLQHTGCCGQLLQHAGSYGQPLQHAGSYGQPLQHAGSYGQPLQHAGSYGQPLQHAGC